MAVNRMIVGVDGSPGARSALFWAADECRTRRMVLFVVHALEGPTDAAVPLPVDQARADLGERLLSEHAAAASARQPGVPVTGLQAHGSAADVLIALSIHSDLVVVGTRGGGDAVATILGSVSHRVAAQAHCPVAVVPEGRSWQETSRIVVGVSDTPSGRMALAFAFEEARLRGATLVAVRASHAVRAGESLDAELAGLVQQYPDVPIEPVADSAEPSEALLRAAGLAELVVVGCHHSTDRWSMRLGPVPAEILYRAPCPVVVVGERHVSRGPAGEDALAAGHA
jgi:nucleotide-binding universal stress UspA family protein